MDTDYGRIHRVAFKAVVSVLFTAAMLAAIGRLAIRFRYQNRLSADDYVLLLGCSSLIAAFTLTNVMFEDIYFDMSLILGPRELVLQESASEDFVNHILEHQQLSFSTEVMCWVTIFAVKMSFLLFFRQLVDRLGALLTFWTVTVGIVVVSWIFCICSIFISCPHFGLSSIVAFPFCLLWKVQIRLQQKIILGTFLCLSVCMFSICLVRTTGEIIDGNTGSAVDVQWNIFWQITEASVAVTVVSLTAFRSLYGIKTLQQEQRNKKQHGPWLSSYRMNMFNRKKQRRVDEFGDTIADEHYSLPSIPGATLTGIRTMIGGMTARSTQALSTRDDLLSVDEAQKEEEPGLIRVVNDFHPHQSARSYV
ncbi:MAG: hypothetical protein Q9181_006953 [Wetmoreana brouardii]